MTVPEIMHDLCDMIAPALALLIVEEPLLLLNGSLPAAFRRKPNTPSAPSSWWKETLFFWLRCAAGVGIAVVIAETSKANQWRSGHPGFPSGHATFAMSAGLCLVLQRGPLWLLVSAPAAILMGVSLAYLRWHTWEDVIAGWILGALIPLLVWRITRPLTPKSK